jgi:CheY-like chemotaxis protein
MAILILDTNPEDQMAAVACFRWADQRMRIDCVNDLQTALDVALKSRPTIVVCDPTLPEMPGPQVCNFLAPRLPPGAIFFAYTKDARFLERCNGAPFSGVLLKPPSRLEALRFLNLSRKEMSIARRERSLKNRRPARLQLTPLSEIKVNVQLARDEGNLKFAVSIFQGARVDNLLRQLGKEVTSFVVLRDEHEVQPSSGSTVLDNNDTLVVVPRKA